MTCIKVVSHVLKNIGLPVDTYNITFLILKFFIHVKGVGANIQAIV